MPLLLTTLCCIVRASSTQTAPSATAATTTATTWSAAQVAQCRQWDLVMKVDSLLCVRDFGFWGLLNGAIRNWHCALHVIPTYTVTDKTDRGPGREIRWRQGLSDVP
jgi:hypothetical protein